MNIEKTYFIVEKTNQTGEIHTSFDGIIKTHCDNPYPALPISIATILCDDLNDINAYNHEKNGTDVFENLSDEFLGNELRNSFCYCVLSTFIERKLNNENHNFKFDISRAIQWDRIYRINPQPPLLQKEIEIINEVRKYFKIPWNDLPLNYASSLKEMEENEVGFVSNDIIEYLENIKGKFNNQEIFVIDLLYNYFNYFSVTMPILWIGNIIPNELLIDAFRVFVLSVKYKPTSKNQKQIRNMNINRLIYLKQFLNANKALDEFI